MSLGENIRTLRQQAHLSQEKLAELVGVSRQAVTKWEKDQSEPSCDNLMRLAEALGVTTSQLTAAPLTKTDWQQRLRFTVMLAAGWLIQYLLARILFGIKENYTVIGWLTGWQSTVYLLGWLLSKKLYWYAAVITCVGSLLGKRRFSLTVAAGFFIGWAAGELFGPRKIYPPAGVEYHYGWVTWSVVFLTALVIGVILERKSHKNN